MVHMLLNSHTDAEYELLVTESFRETLHMFYTFLHKNTLQSKLCKSADEVLMLRSSYSSVSHPQPTCTTPL